MISLQQVYEELALRHDRQQEARQRDVFLVLAADAALAAGRVDDAERLRLQLLHLTPHSLLRPYGSLTEALQSRDIQDYIADLRRLYPPDQAEKLLNRANGKPETTPSPTPIYRLQDEPPPRPASAPASAAQPRTQSPSPYERYEVPLPPGRGYDSGESWIALALFTLVFVAAVCLAAYVIVKPLVQ